jgi:hypothetical protein
MPRDYRQEYDRYQGTPEQRKRNDQRKKSRRAMVKKHGKSALRGKDVDHKDRNPSNQAKSNLRIQSPSQNRSRNGRSRSA